MQVVTSVASIADLFKISASLENSTYYTITSGIDAIAFTPLYETGGQFAARSPVTIEASRLITSAEDPCRLVIGGTPHVYFSSVNAADRTLTVPLSFTDINAIHSITGEAVPPENFAPGTSGFSVPEAYFTSGTTLVGVWKFLGQDIKVSSDLQICTDRGVPGACEVIDPAKLRSPFEYTRRVILKLTNLSIAAARTGKWKGASGGFSVPFLSRGARALVTMEKVFRDSKAQSYVCEVTPMSCTVKRIPKQTLVKAFSQIFKGKVPRGLEHLSSMSKREIALFQREMRKLPEKYVTCD